MSSAKPEKCVDWRIWGNMREVELFQACLLSLNLDPENVEPMQHAWMIGNAGESGPYFELGKETESEYRKRLMLLKNNLTNREHFSPGRMNLENPNFWGVRLPEFAAWALTIPLELPDELVALARPREVRMQSEISAPMPEENKISTQSSVTELPTRLRENLLRTIIVLAIEGYRFDPSAKKNDAIKQIVEDLKKYNVNLTDDTIRGYLTDARKLIELPKN